MYEFINQTYLVLANLHLKEDTSGGTCIIYFIIQDAIPACVVSPSYKRQQYTQNTCFQ